MGSVRLNGSARIDQGTGSCTPGCSAGGAGGGAGGGAACTIPLGFGGACTDRVFDLCPLVPLRVNTLGTVGQNFDRVDCVRDIARLELLIVESDRPIVLRFDPTRPTITTAVIPTGGITTGSATVTVHDTTGMEFSGVAAFDGTTNTRPLVVQAINAALGGAGAPTPEGTTFATLNADGTVTIASSGVGPAATVALVDAATGVLTDDDATGTARDMLPTQGTVVIPFDRSTAPTDLWISGNANVQLVAAGTAA